MTIFFQIIPKTLFWGHFGSLLAKIGEKRIFLEKRALPVLNIAIIYHRAKKKKIIIKTHSCEKCRPTDDGDFI